MTNNERHTDERDNDERPLAPVAALISVRMMSRWINVVLVYVLLGAVLLIITRALLPIIGLGGFAGELIEPLADLTPILVGVSLAAITLIAFSLRRQAKLANQWSDKAEIWSDEAIIGGVELSSANADVAAGGAAGVNTSLKAESVPERSVNVQADERNGNSNGRGLAPLPAITTASKSEGLEVAAAAATAVLDKVRGERRTGTAEIVRERSEDRANKRSENKDNVSSTDEDVFARYRHLIESPFSPMATFHQLPPPLPEFVGRSAELVELYAARANHDVRVLSVQGPGGAGKTTLALKLADQLKAHYPDAQFYLDLKGSSPQPLSVIEAQSAVIRAYLPTVCLPENEVELDRLYHSALAGKRVLLLLDNVAGAQQVAPLVAPDGCITIVTSRDQIALPGTFSKQLENLTPAEARDFLMRIVPRIDGQAARVAELCEHLPLALRLAASALLISADLKISDYIQRMERLQWNGSLPPSDRAAAGAGFSQTAARPTLHPVDAALSMSYDLLVPGLQKLWRMLAVFRDTFDVSAAASVWQITPVRTNNALDRLMAYSLIERNRATGRYRLHDLTARFAETRSNQQEMTTARQRFSAHYQSVLHEADALYEQGGESLRRGLGLIDLEWSNIQDGQVWAATNVDADHAARELCNSYPDAGKYVLELRQRPRERIRWSEAALTAAQKLNQRNAAVRHLVALGDSYNALSEVHHAIGCYEQALEIAREACDRRGEAEALSGLGAAHYLGGGLKRACDLHREALELFSRVGPRRREADSLGNLGLAYFATGDLRNALILFDQQLKAAREIGDRRGESQALGGLGTTHYATGDAEKAAELFNQQLAITREIGDRRGEASALGNVGSAYAALKRHRQAISFHEQSLLVAREIGDRRGEASALGGLGIAEYLDGNLSRSIELLNKQLRLASELGDRRGEAIALSNLGEAYVASGDYQTATDMLTSAFNIASQIGDIQAQANALFNLSLALDQTGDRKQAIAQAEIALELFQIAEHPYAQVVKERLIQWGAR